MSLFKVPSPLTLEGNWRKWKQRFQLYMEASGSIKKPEKQQVAIFFISEKKHWKFTTHSRYSLKTKNGWKPTTVTKLDHTPRSVIVTSNRTLYRRNRRDIIKTPDVKKDTITSPTSDRGITKSPGSHIINTPDIIRTRSGRTIRPPRLNDFEYY